MATTTVQEQQEQQGHTVVDRLAPLAATDPVVAQGLARGLLRVDGRSLVPSGADYLTMAVARGAAPRPPLLAMPCSKVCRGHHSGSLAWRLK